MTANDSGEYLKKVRQLRAVINIKKKKLVIKYGPSVKNLWSK